MPTYEVTARVTGLVCFYVEADDEREATEYAEETWEMNVGDIQCCDLDELDVKLDSEPVPDVRL